MSIEFNPIKDCVRDIMVNEVRSVPTWGAFRKISPKQSSFQNAIDESEANCSAHEPNTPLMTSPVEFEGFDGTSQDSFYAQSDIERNELEFDELGEGALRQIGRSFVSVVSGVSAVALIVGVGFWSLSIGTQAGHSTTIANSEIQQDSRFSDQPVEVAVGREFFVSDIANNDIPTPLASRDIFEITIDMPVPSVIATASDNSKKPDTIINSIDYPSPVPISREFAIAALSSYEDGPLAQGSDDESNLNPADPPALSEPYVSVFAPLDRPVF